MTRRVRKMLTRKCIWPQMSKTHQKCHTQVKKANQTLLFPEAMGDPSPLIHESSSGVGVKDDKTKPNTCAMARIVAYEENGEAKAQHYGTLAKIQSKACTNQPGQRLSTQDNHFCEHNY